MSVVMPAYNMAAYVGDAVASMLAQTYDDFELIVVDDGSTDDTVAKVRSFADPRVRLEQNAHQGLVGAENHGIAVARGEYICRADADDVFDPTLLDKQVQVLDANPRTGAVGAWHRYFGGRQRTARPPTEPDRIRQRLRTSNTLVQPVMMRAEAIRQVGPFRPVIWEDWDLWIRIASRWDIRNIPEVLTLLRSRNDSILRSANVQQRERGRRQARYTAAKLIGVDARSLVALTRSTLLTPIAPMLPRLRRPAGEGRVATVPPADPTLSVVVPTYQRLRLVQECLAGVAAQQPQPDEVIVVHRPAHDPEAAEWLPRWAAEDASRRRVVSVDEPGLVAALRAGTDAATGDIVAYLDDDAVPRAGWLAELLLGYTDPTVAGVCGPLVEHVDGAEVTGRAKRVGVITWYGRVIGNHHLRCDHYGDVDLAQGPNMSFRRDTIVHDPRLLRMHNGLVLGNELQTCLLVRKAGGRILYSPWAVVDHYPNSYRDPVLSSRVSGDDLVAAAANYTFILLSFLPWHRRIAYRLYAYLVGSANQSGPVRAVLELPRNPARARVMLARVGPTWRGRWRGERMFRANRSRNETAASVTTP